MGCCSLIYQPDQHCLIIQLSPHCSCKQGSSQQENQVTGVFQLPIYFRLNWPMLFSRYFILTNTVILTVNFIGQQVKVLNCKINSKIQFQVKATGHLYNMIPTSTFPFSCSRPSISPLQHRWLLIQPPIALQMGHLPAPSQGLAPIFLPYNTNCAFHS